jgi:Protein of unknown function (DUF2911)
MKGALGTLVVVVLLTAFSIAEGNDPKSQVPDGNTVCTFGDGQQMSVRYAQIPYSKAEPARGKVWMPDNRPMYLFSQSELQIGKTTVPPGAYSLYAIPGDEEWTLVVNKGVEQRASYDASKDLAKLQAQTGELSRASDRLTLYFGRISPTKCTLRIDYGKQRAFADFEEK